MLIEAGTVKSALLSLRTTVTPPLGAAAERPTVQVLLEPEASVAGEHTSEDTVTAGAAERLREAVMELPFSAAVTIAVCDEVTVPAVALKEPLVAPAITLTDAGTVSAELLSETLAVTPPVGAALFRPNVQAAMPPDCRVDGAHCREVSRTGATTVTEVVLELPA